MKTDSFNDRIRQKLDSFEPSFRERDWGRFDAHRRIAGKPGPNAPGQFINTLHHLWQPLAGAVVVGGLLLGNWWQYQSQKELNQTVQTLTTTVQQLRNNNPTATTTDSLGQIGAVNFRNINDESLFSPSLRRVIFPSTEKRTADTVYITRYVSTTPPSARPGGLAGNVFSENRPANLVVPSSGRSVDALTGRLVQSAPTTANNRNTTQRGPTTSQNQQQRLGLRTAQNGSNQDNNTNSQSEKSAENQTENQKNEVTETSASGLTAQLNMAALSPSERRQLKRLLRRTATAQPKQSRQTAAEQLANGRAQVLTDQPQTNNLNNSGPLLLANNLLPPAKFDSGYYDMDIARQLRRFRSPLNRAAETVAPDSPIKTALVQPVGRFRVGVMGSLGYRQSGAGLYAEQLIGSRWVVGAGLTTLKLSGETFLTDDDFDKRLDKDFRREFAPGIDPGHSILNITRRSTVWQVPISVGYRVSMGQNWSVVPTGTFNLNIWNQENVRFNYIRGPKMPPEQQNISLIYDQRNYHSATFSLNFEKQWAHWGLQGGPYLTVPTAAVSPVSSLNTLSGGIRLRAFLQF